MEKVSVLITSPSISVSDNVSGIANLTSLLIGHNQDVKYYHFVTGKKDNQARNMTWLYEQFFLPIKFVMYLFKNLHIKICHLNVPQESFAIIREGVLAIVAKLMNKKIIIHLRGGKYNRSRIKAYSVRQIFKMILLIADKIVCLSEVEKEYIEKNYNLSPLKTVALPNAVMITKDILPKNYNGTLNVLFLGRIEKDKGLDEIITVLKNINKLVKCKFLLCGTGPYEKFVTDELNKAIPKEFVKCGIVSGAKKNKILTEAHIFLLPSYYEGLPNALLEAMAYGVIPVCTAVGSVPSVIRDGENGFLVPLHDSSSIENIIIDLNAHRKKMEALSANAYLHIKKNYSLFNYIESLNNIYSELSVVH